MKRMMGMAAPLLAGCLVACEPELVLLGQGGEGGNGGSGPVDPQDGSSSGLCELPTMQLSELPLLLCQTTEQCIIAMGGEGYHCYRPGAAEIGFCQHIDDDSDCDVRRDALIQTNPPSEGATCAPHEWGD